MFYVVDFESGKTLFFEGYSWCETADYADRYLDTDGEYTISEYDSEEHYLSNL